MMWALIVDGEVHEVTDVDPKGRFHESMQWVPCGQEVQERWTYDGSKFSEPVEPEAPPAPPTTIPGAVFFDRLSEDEADQLDEAMMAKPVKFRRAWMAATEFIEGTDLWPVLLSELEALFGSERAGELLAAL